MAQTFVNGGIALPYSSRLPYELNSSGTFGSIARSGGVCRGTGENVYRLEFDGSSTYNEIDFTLSPSVASGSLAVKIRQPYSDAPTGVNQVALDIGGHSIRLPAPPSASVDHYYNNANQTAYNAFFPTAFSAEKPRYIRVNWTGTTFQARGWNYDEAEPATWPIDLSAVNVSATSPVLKIYGAKGITDLHWAAVSDDSTEAAYKSSIAANDTTTYPGGNKTVSITDATASATIRLYHQGTGILLASGTTDANGAASFDITTDSICYAIVTDPTDARDTSINFLNRGA